MKILTEKIRRWLRTHRRSRRHAALQNLCVALLLAALGVVLLRGYMTDNSVEAVVRQWCEENFFGEAEIVASITFEEDRHQQKWVYVEKVMPDGDRYEARVDLIRENPWKWTSHGSIYSTEPAASQIDKSMIQTYGERAHIVPSEALEGMFPELAECKFLHASYSTVHIVEDENTVNNSYPAFQVYMEHECEADEITPEVLLFSSSSFRMNLRTGEMDSVYFEPFELDGKMAELWISDERLKQITHALMESLPEKK